MLLDLAMDVEQKSTALTLKRSTLSIVANTESFQTKNKSTIKTGI